MELRKVMKIGDSLTVSIPTTIVKQSKIEKGGYVEVGYENDHITIKRHEFVEGQRRHDIMKWINSKTWSSGADELFRHVQSKMPDVTREEFQIEYEVLRKINTCKVCHKEFDDYNQPDGNDCAGYPGMCHNCAGEQRLKDHSAPDGKYYQLEAEIGELKVEYSRNPSKELKKRIDNMECTLNNAH